DFNCVTVPLSHGPEEVFVVLDLKLGIKPALHRHQRPAGGDQFVNLRGDLVVRQYVPFGIAGTAVEGAVGTVRHADVRVAHNPHDQIRGTPVGVTGAARLMGETPQCV